MKVKCYALWDVQFNECIQIHLDKYQADKHQQDYFRLSGHSTHPQEKLDEALPILCNICDVDIIAKELLKEYQHYLEVALDQDSLSIKSLTMRMWVHIWTHKYASPPYEVVPTSVDIDLDWENCTESIEKADEIRAIVI